MKSMLWLYRYLGKEMLHFNLFLAERTLEWFDFYFWHPILVDIGNTICWYKILSVKIQWFWLIDLYIFKISNNLTYWYTSLNLFWHVQLVVTNGICLVAKLQSQTPYNIFLEPTFIHVSSNQFRVHYKKFWKNQKGTICRYPLRWC